MAYDTSVRQYLQGKGVASGDIGYDKASGNVTVRGKNFYKPELNTAGTTYSNQQNLDNAYNTYKSSLPVIQSDGSIGTTSQVPIAVPTTEVKPLTATATTTPVAQTDTNSFQQQISDIMKQMNDSRSQAPVDVYGTPQYAAAQAQQQKAAQQSTRSAQEVLGQSGFARSTNIADRAQHIQNDANDYLTTQIVPLIQSQLQAERQQKQQDLQNQFNNLYQLSAQQDNQQYHKDDLATQIAQLTGNYNPSGKSVDQIQSQMDVNSKAYATASQEERDRLHQENIDLAKLLGKTYDSKTGTYSAGQGYVGTKTVAQQQLEQNNMKDMAILTGHLPDGTKTSAQQQQDLQNEWAVADQLGTVTKKLANLYGITEGTPTRAAKEFAQSLAIQQQNANTSAYSAANSAKNAAANQQLAQDRFEWDRSVNNPDNIYKNAQIEELKKGSSPEIGKELDGLYTGISTGQITKANAIAEINDKVKVGLLSQAVANKMLAVVSSTQSSAPNITPQLTQDQIDGLGGNNPQDLNSAQLEKIWKTDPTGKAAGAPIIDWGAWYRDPRGRVGGVPYKTWVIDFGPQLRAK